MKTSHYRKLFLLTVRQRMRKMTSCQEPLLKSDEEDDLVFDRTGLLSNKITAKHDVCQRGHSPGKKMQYARTVNLCLAFFALGLCFAIPTATLNDLQTSLGADLANIEFIYTARYSGYVFGAIIGGILFDRYNRQFLLFLSLLATAIGIITMPFCTKVGALMACTAITGITMGFLDTGGNVWCLDLWGKKSAPLMQTLHFCFGLGAFVAPLVAEPFLSPHTGNTTGLIDLSPINATLKNVPHVWFPHQRMKAFSENIHQHINSSAAEQSFHETSLLHKMLRHTSQSGQKFMFKKSHVIARPISKRHVGLLTLKENVYTTNNNTNETEKSNVSTNFSDSMLNNTIISQNTLDYFTNSSLQEDSTVTYSVVTTSNPMTDLSPSIKQKPKKPHYADGNQLKHDDKWVRTSLKVKTQNDVSRNSKQESNRTSEKTSTASDIDFLNTGSLLVTSTADYESIKMSTTSRLHHNSISEHKEYNGTEDAELRTLHFRTTKKPAVFPAVSTGSFFSNTKNITLSATTAYNVHNSRAVEIIHLPQNVTTVDPSVKVDSSTKRLSAVMPVSNHTDFSMSLHLSGHNRTEFLSTESTSFTDQFPKDESVILSSWSNASFISSTTDITNKTEFKQTSLRSAETNELANSSPPSEIYNIGTVMAIGIHSLNEEPSDVVRKTHESMTSHVNLSNSLQEDSLDVKVTNIITTTESIADVKGKKDSHTDFLSSLFATMCQHRLGKFEIAYVILGIYISIVACIFLICLCLNPREPRSRQEEQLDKSKSITATFRISVIILVSLFLCLYVGMEVAVGQLLQTFTVKQYLQLPESTGYFMTYSFWGSFALARGISIALSMKFSGLCLLFLDLIICLTTSILLVIGANKIEALLWVGIVVLAFGMAPIFPAVIAWIEHYLPITNRIASVFILGAALGEMTIPLIIQRFIYQEPMVLMYVNVIVNILCLVTFVALWILASHQGEKYKGKIDRTMYQLANFDDIEDGYELCFANSRWQNDYNSHILLERKLVGKTN